MTLRLISVRNLLGASSLVPYLGDLFVDDCLLDCRDWSLARIVGHVGGWNLAQRRVFLDSHDQPLSHVLGMCREASLVMEFPEPRLGFHWSSGDRNEAGGVSRGMEVDRAARAGHHPRPAIDCDPSVDSPLRSSRSLLSGHLCAKGARVGPIVDLLLDVREQRLRFLVVRHDLATDDEEQMFVDVQASRGFECRVDEPAAVRFNCREISELLAMD